jgi:hypothetical protein
MRHFLAAIAVIAASAGAAHAGGYVAIGAGGDADLHGDLENHFTTEGASAGRLAIGQRFGPLAVEAVLFGTDLHGASGMTGPGNDYSTMSLGVDLKYHIPLVGGLEAYGRAGLNKTWVVDGFDTTMDLGYSGRGYNLGAGLQYGFRLLPLVEAAIWADYNHQVMTLHEQGRASLEGGADMLTLGVSLGTVL